MIQLDHITLTYPDGGNRITAVDNVTLTVAPGTVVGITGPSGSGKSSLLAVASTLVTPDTGSVLIGGVDATALTLAEKADLRRDRLGIIFQQPILLPALTAAEQLVVMGELDGRRGGARGRGRARIRALELLTAVGLADQAGKRPAQLSGGQRQRVEIARALMNEPSVLVVDEPTSALDQERGSEILALILRLTAEHDTATVLVTHDQRLLPLMSAVHTMVDGTLTPS
ncbi:ABC transporter ATP-binding protein [Cryobacterium sp. TMT1-21]|uniref:ABC transporter ATP-binding protein n=1 Tax=Cryobacterium shii TaxID=1259235 RepID=A0AAQ2C7I1_9MICO|nr:MULTISPECIES: ABC transporter ATP-binding protein [Cryobacterium]TFC51181.1 ABC transporter ATP-binding protein [Cryobacterium shii]TFC80933.1 ABC transporter ATP-binding protein [Cryobacterium sp. TmT2-59]TFD11378.1 ABC transporter ATP-binding protein [Cryobacterium sp. TMT1-21]TFD18804.1 ABC transporter ATP-binding protein [Cryobacterium sp. TMT2-23]TFD18883.1 ABC transporter ATP-binding protein [Cryobacterium sp. TMT4-10]